MPRHAPRPRIAIVVDDGPLRNALSFLLEADGWETAAFSTGAALLERLPQANCLLVDHHLPDMDGLSLIAKTQAAGMTVPAVVIAGKPGEKFRKRAAEAGIEIVDKPLVGDEVRRQIRAALDGAG
jgi:two-component system response regulator FixJ